ncbi:DUF3696 domain-containing protein [Paraglaciecola sp. 20A4]|uniref:AAA family ATPase n=1 Tax=Paraglaciecola sp. 20A4 TaxID=2687288 RepID=UPI00140986A4|nr:DUF3696 domain-containing protein [Paraglaciecola sp. 20A4]
MINYVDLKAFKSFPNKRIDFRKLTLFSGINNSGKSSIIQAMRMFYQAADGESPLLQGHGTVNEMRSKFSSPTEVIQIEFGFTDGCHSILKIDGSIVEKPSRVPVHSYIGADRLGPKTSLPLLRALVDYPRVGDQGEFVLDYLQHLGDCILPDALVHEKAQGKTLEYVLAGWLNEISPGVEFSFKLNNKADIAHAEIDSYRPTNVGFGLSYTLPVITAILGMAVGSPLGGWTQSWGARWEELKTTNGAVVIIENPEAHLHPQGQTAMGRLIALAAGCGVQMVVETHSDHLMDGIRIAVKEMKIDAEDVAFHYLTKNSKGISEVATPKLDQNGKLEFWPDGFFDQTLKNRAQLARKS